MIAISTIVLTMILLILTIGRFLAPTEALRDRMRRILAGLAEFWISINNAILSLYRSPLWKFEIPENLDRNGCYLVSSNHQSWVDVLVLQRCFNDRLPFFRFFIKSQLFWLPFLGVAWWALDMPFVHRHSRDKLARQPGLKGRDLESARKSCLKFRNIPVAMTNFPEGTRFTIEKRDDGKSPYQNLLKPRIGGLGQVLYALADELDAVIDATIVYPQTTTTGLTPTFWQLLTGEIPEIIVKAERRDIPPELLGRNFRTDHEFRRELEAWVDQMWRDKDKLITETLGSETRSQQSGHQCQANRK